MKKISNLLNKLIVKQPHLIALISVIIFFLVDKLSNNSYFVKIYLINFAAFSSYSRLYLNKFKKKMSKKQKLQICLYSTLYLLNYVLIDILSGLALGKLNIEVKYNLLIYSIVIVIASSLLAIMLFLFSLLEIYLPLAFGTYFMKKVNKINEANDPKSI